ncbi:MAG: DUF2723 domain-containing protein [Anaerolineae bacterium]|nr:DUF2723 domain-containing protein [Anaerolineae bacterium]
MNRKDYWIGLAVFIFSLALYTRTLAPDILYGDSAEFQTLAYTLGTTHSTGYPIYLLLARVVGLLPLRSPAWRVSFFSALCGAITVGNIALLIRYVTHSRVGMVLGSLSLAISYTFWSQAVIAEVYTPATAFITTITLLLWHWQQDPQRHTRALFAAAVLACLGLGIHASVGLLAPAAASFVILVLIVQRVTAWRRTLGTAAAGVAVGFSIYLIAFLLLELHNPPTSFMRAGIYPSRSIWGLSATDLDSPWERMWITVSGRQWQNVMFSKESTFLAAWNEYAGRVTHQEFSYPLAFGALAGLIVMARIAPASFAFCLTAFGSMLFFILNYNPGDKYIFYLPTYLFLAIALGVGIGQALEGLQHQIRQEENSGSNVLYGLTALFLVFILLPSSVSRWQALRDGAATFVTEDYAYPIYNLDEPRLTSMLTLVQLPDNAVVIMRWRALYTIYYLAHVEGKKPGLTLIEATPYGSDGLVADTLITHLTGYLEEGRPVYTDDVFPNLRDHFRVMPAPRRRLYRLSLPE